MSNLHFICTQHRETGICNSAELHKIIDGISPEIIFEELPLAVYDDIYKEESRTTLESDAIKMYLQNHSIKHIPVDTFERSTRHEDKVAQMYNALFQNAKKESFTFRNIMEQFNTAVSKNGFSYLNNNANDKALEIIETQKQEVLGILNDDSLFEIAKEEREVIEDREDTILDNVYRYGEENQYEIGILFIGSGHRKSMFTKIAKRKKLEQTEINWILYN